MACFLLAFAITVVVLLFHASMRYQRSLLLRGRAVLMAQQKMSEIRAWAKIPANFISPWVPYQGTTSVSLEAPQIQIRCDCNPAGRPLFSPCATLELPHGADARVMRKSIIPVTVTASWGPGSSQRVRLMSYIGQPVPPVAVRKASILTLGPIPSPVGPGLSVPVSLSGVDGSGQALEDFFFTWDVQSHGGNARIPRGTPRDGRNSRLENLYEFSALVPATSIPGEVTLRAATRYHGNPVEVVSGRVMMQ